MGSAPHTHTKQGSGHSFVFRHSTMKRAPTLVVCTRPSLVNIRSSLPNSRGVLLCKLKDASTVATLGRQQIVRRAFSKPRNNESYDLHFGTN